MPVARSLYRRIATVLYSANNVVPTRLEVTGKVRRLFLELTGTLDVTGAMTAAVTQNPGTLVPTITLRFNEQTILKSGRWLDWINRAYVFDKLPVQVTAAAGVAAYAFRSRIQLPFVTPWGARPIDTILVIGDRDRLDLDIGWGDENSLGTGGTKAFTVNPEIRVIAEMINDVNVEPVATYKEGAFEDAVGTAANTDYQGLDLVTGPGVNYHHQIIAAEDNVANSLRALVDVIDQVQIQMTGQGIVSTPFGQVTGPQLQQDFNQDSVRVDAPRVGIYPVLWQPRFDGRMTYNLVTADLNDLRFLINHTLFATAGTFRVAYGTVEPLG